MANLCSPRPASLHVFLFSTTLVLCLLALAAPAQLTEDSRTLPPPVQQQHPATVPADLPVSAAHRPLRVDVNLVLVPVTVTDPANKRVNGLRMEDFLLFEDGEPQTIRYFSSEDVPISVGVLLDVSKSMSNKIDDAREAVKDFFSTANPEDEFFVVTFSDSPALLADNGQSLGSIQAKLATATPGGHTSLLDAIYLGVSKLRRARYARHALLIISDGGDNHSRYRASEIKRLVAEADVQIYAIGIFDTVFKTPEEWTGKRLLTAITETTGGRTITMNNASQLPRIASAISLDLRNQYVLGYHPRVPARDGRWRKISVRLAPTADPALHLHFRRGYLAPSE